MSPVGAFFHELVQTGIYKRSQGRITRQVTFAAAWLVVAVGLWRMFTIMQTSDWKGQAGGIEYWLPGILLIVGTWIVFRAVNFPAFADFLIAVEAEMNKVSWPSRTELVRASMVVLIMLVALAVVLFFCDAVWRTIIGWVLRS
jgi:preprotein translocase subunit SecE